MYACVCQAVTEETVREAIAVGAATLEDVASATGASTRCGMCAETIVSILEES